MLTRLARLALLAELAAYVLIGAWLHAARGWSVPAIVATCAACLVAARVAFVAASYALGRIAARALVPGAALGPLPGAAVFLRECAAVLASNLVNVPFAPLVLPREPPLAPTTRVPVLLVHGYFASRGFFVALARWLGRQGVKPVLVPDFPGTFASIEQFAQALHVEIERIVAATGRPRLVLVCHSMGGLAARRYLADHGAGRVARLVTIGSPHAGTALARLGMGANARQMLPGSDFLRRLAEAEAGRAPCETTSIYTWHDNLVTPQGTSRLAWAREVALEGAGHIAILRSPRVFAIVLEELRAAGVEPGPR